MTLTDINNGFRDDGQRRRVKKITHDRLTNDRDPQECRFLMRFRWHLVISYREESMGELGLNFDKPNHWGVSVTNNVEPA
ncbi:hypothetical protein ACH4E8_19740 [Streptomyces sp. NPDC017979]|uniref:hypothetical protein n=1 Tax=Streptomyces sp. NPDC017979 TaxID=3365024 RepID=UPI00378D6BF0